MVVEVFLLSLSKPAPGVRLEKGAYSVYQSTLCQSFPTRLIYIIYKFYALDLTLSDAAGKWDDGEVIESEMTT